MSDTPRTDAVSDRIEEELRMGSDTGLRDYYEWACQLERELNRLAWVEFLNSDIDAERYRWLKARGAHHLAGIAWQQSKAACQVDSQNVDDVIDAAMKDSSHPK